jgi:hypothetical protein
MKRQKAEDWLKDPKYSHYVILDPDGWDRQLDKWEASWNEEITEVEFNKRLMHCAISVNHKPHLKENNE